MTSRGNTFLRGEPLLARAIAAALVLGACLEPALAQDQELYTLSRLNKIWRIDGFDGPSPNAVEIGSWTDVGGLFQPLALAREPISETFYILTGAWVTGPSSVTNKLSRFDPVTGTTTLVMEFPYTKLRGLERRWDGTLVTVDDGSALVFIDPDDGSITEQPLSSSLMSSSLFLPFDIRSSGDLRFLSPEPQQVDPATGEVSVVAGAPNTSNFSAFSISNTDDFYAASAFPGDLFRYDGSLDTWIRVFDNGLFTTNNVYDIDLTNAEDGFGFERVCNGHPTSTGSRTTLVSYGSAFAPANDLELVARGIPSPTIGMFLLGTSEGSVMVGSGELCIGAPFERYGASLSVLGGPTYRFRTDLTDLPGNQAAVTGDTFLFQLWFRDSVNGVPTTNLSDAISVTFL